VRFKGPTWVLNLEHEGVEQLAQRDKGQLSMDRTEQSVILRYDLEHVIVRALDDCRWYVGVMDAQSRPCRQQTK
jgi:hypothetical protein